MFPHLIKKESGTTLSAESGSLREDKTQNLNTSNEMLIVV